MIWESCLHPFIKENKVEVVLAALFAIGAACEAVRVATAPLSEQGYRQAADWTGHRVPDDMPADIYTIRAGWGFKVFAEPDNHGGSMQVAQAMPEREP